MTFLKYGPATEHTTDLRRRVFDILPFASAQSRAEIKLLPVLEYGWQPYWNSISGFDFDVCIVIGMSFCICWSNFEVMGSELLPHIYFSTWRPWSRKSTSELRFIDGICLRRWKSICMPYEISQSQSTADIKLLRVSENGRPPYWHSISGLILTFASSPACHFTSDCQI